MTFSTRSPLMDQRRLLRILCESDGYTACDGRDLATAHALEERGWAEWMGTSWGSSFWMPTELGRAKAQELGLINPPLPQD